MITKQKIITMKELNFKWYNYLYYIFVCPFILLYLHIKYIIICIIYHFKKD